MNSIHLLRCAALGAFTASAAMILPAAAAAETEVPHLTHLIRIVAEFEVEGHNRVDFDEWVECRGVELGRGRGADIRQRRVYIAKPAPTGGAVVLYVHPPLCRFWGDAWRNPAAAARMLSPNFLPHIYWIDDIRNPSEVEAYYSEAYHNQLKRRVKLLHFEAKLRPFNSPHEDIERARKQEGADPPMRAIEPRGCGLYCWDSIHFAPIPEREWRQVPELDEALANVDAGQGIVQLSEGQTKLVARFKFNKIVSWSVLGLGVPRAADDHGLIGVRPMSQVTDAVWRGRLARRADELIPIRCREDICRPLLDERGYVIFYRKERFRSPDGFRWLEFKGQRFDLREFSIWRGALFDPVSRTIFIRDRALR